MTEAPLGDEAAPSSTGPSNSSPSSGPSSAGLGSASAAAVISMMPPADSSRKKSVNACDARVRIGASWAITEV